MSLSRCRKVQSDKIQRMGQAQSEELYDCACFIKICKISGTFYKSYCYIIGNMA